MSAANDQSTSHGRVSSLANPGPAPGDASITEVLARLSLISAGSDSLLVPDAVVQAAVNHLHASIALIRTLTPDGLSLAVTSAAGPGPDMVRGLLGSYSPVTSSLEKVAAGSGIVIAIDQEDGPDGYLTATERWTFAEFGATEALLIPLHASGRLVGRFDLACTLNHPLTSEFQVQAGLLGAAAAAALNFERLTAEAQEAMVHRAVFGLYQQVEHLADPKTILQSAVELARREPGCHRAYAMLWRDDRSEFVPIAVAGLEPRLVEMLKMISLSPQVVPAIDRMMHSGETIIIDDAKASTLLPRSLVDTLGMRAAMFVPLRGRRHRTLGFILLDYSEDGHDFSEEDERVMAGMAPPLSTMIENAMLYEDVITSSDSLAVINEIGIQLAMLSDEESLFRQLHRQVGSVVDATYFAVGLLTDSRQEFDLRVAAEGEFRRYRTHYVPGNDPIARAVQLGRGSSAGTRESTAPDQWVVRVEGSALCHSQMTVPITVGRSVVGAMTVRSPLRHAYGPHDLSVFGAIGVHTGVALENARLYRMVQERGNRRAAVLDQVLQKQETERKELVDDIHDNTLQTLAACLYNLDRAHLLVQESKDTDVLVEQIESVRTELADNIDRLRKRIFEVRPATLDILGLQPALKELLSAIEEQSGIAIDLEVRLPGRLTPKIETAVYRLIQESLSLLAIPGKSRMLTLRLHANTEHVIVNVHNPIEYIGSEIEAEQPGIAMLALIERAELLGGDVLQTHNAGKGSTLQITLPLIDGKTVGEHSAISTVVQPIDGFGDNRS